MTLETYKAHQAIMNDWAAGAEIEYSYDGGLSWRSVNNDVLWTSNFLYRIKETPRSIQALLLTLELKMLQEETMDREAEAIFTKIYEILQ